jgi:hypothetical protein
VEGNHVDNSLVGGVGAIDLIVHESVEHLHGVTRELRVDSDEGILVSTSNLTTILEIPVACNATIGAGLIILAGASGSIASPTNVADVVEGERGIRNSERGIERSGSRFGVNDARSGEGGSDTGEGSAVEELVVVALTRGIRASAVSGVDESVATVTEISVDSVAVTVHGIATSLVEASGEALASETSVGNALRDGRREAEGRDGAASRDGAEVTGVPVVKSVAVLGVLALGSVALANINEERGLSREQEVAEEGVDEGVGAITERLGVHVRGGLSELPGVEGRRATTTHAGLLGDRAGANLEGNTIGDVVVVINIPVEELGSIQGGSRGSHRGEIDDAVNALSRASRPLGPGRELAVLLNTLKLVGALHARSDGGGADANLVEGGLDEGNTENVLEVRSNGVSIGKLVIKLVGSGEHLTLDVEHLNGEVRELGVVTTVIGGGDGATITSLNRNVTEDASTSAHVPEETAVIRARALSPVGPGVHGGSSGGDIGVRPLLVDSSLASVVLITVLVRAAGDATSVLRIAGVIRLGSAITEPTS